MKPTVPDVIPLIEAYYKKPGNEVGGNLHVVLDDYNIDTASVQFCLDQATAENDADGVKLAEMLLQMSRTQRLKAATKAKKYWG